MFFIFSSCLDSLYFIRIFNEKRVDKKLKILYNNAYIGIMSFIRYKKFGKKEYAYEVRSVWDTNIKRARQKTKYLGVVIDREKGIYKKREIKLPKEKLILDFGDTYIIYQFLKNNKLLQIIKNVFKEKANYLLSLIFYRLCNSSAMKYTKIWYEGNIAKILFKDNDFSSQRISEFLGNIGDEERQREFFKAYVSPFVSSPKGIIIDTTALPNQIHLPFNVWGYHNENIDKQIKFLFVIDKDSSLPLFFRYLPGNIVDVSSLKVTIEELKRYRIKGNFVLLDAGFFSEDNLKELYKENISFLIRLPSSRRLYKELIRKEGYRIEKIKYATKYGKRVLFVKERKVNLFGSKVYGYIILDPERRGREIKKELLKVADEISSDIEEALEYELMKKGVMILVSSSKIKREEVVPLYYIRDTAEKLFRFSKEEISLIPLRVHKEETLRGFLFLSYITLIVYLFLKKEIGREYSVEEVLFTMRNLKCKIYDDGVIVQELTKQQREILERLNIIVPKNSGI